MQAPKNDSIAILAAAIAFVALLVALTALHIAVEK